MPLVLVHGVPETTAVWGPLRAELGRDDVIALSPPGFGAPVPDGFGATSDDYLSWLITELERIDGPVDLVGHDWGGGHVQRLAARRPDLIRSWASDIVGAADPEYVWHDLARAWQTPGVGEDMIAGMFGAPVQERAAGLVQFGMTPDVAKACAEAGGPVMGACVLALYRSAVLPAMTEWAQELDRAERRPGLVIAASADTLVGGVELARRSAERFGARLAVLEGLGHWWMLEDPVQAAAVLTEFHAGLDR